MDSLWLKTNESNITTTYLLMWEDIDAALDALLTVVGPGVAAHPLTLALGALVLAEAPLLALVRG